MKPEERFVNRKWTRRIRGAAVIILTVIAALAISSCSSDEDVRSRQTTEKKKTQVSGKAKWAQMLLRSADSTQQNWVGQMATWPDTIRLTVDSAGRAKIDDLTFALDIFTFKNLDYDQDTLFGGLRMSLIVGAAYVPTHLIMKDYSVDSVLLFMPGQPDAVARKELFAARRNFVDGVWQVEFLPTERALLETDFPEGTRLVPRAFVSWKGKTIIFEMSPIVYEYSRTPRPITG